MESGTFVDRPMDSTCVIALVDWTKMDGPTLQVTLQVVLDLNRLHFYQERRRKYVSGILKPCLFVGY